MAVFTVLSGPTANTATGMGQTSHAFWDGTNLWVFVLTGTTVLTPYSSSDISTFTAQTALTLATVHNSEGRDYAIAGEVISGTPVAHVVREATTSATVHRSYHSSAQFSGTTPTWRNSAAEFQIGSTNTSSHTGLTGGPAALIDSNNKPVHAYGWSVTAVYDGYAIQFVNADAGSSGWTQGTITEKQVLVTTGSQGESRFMGNLGSGHYFYIVDNANATGTPNNLQWSYWNGSTWTSTANVFSSSVNMNVNDWGGVVDSTGKIHFVRRTAATTYEHRIYSGAGGTMGAGASIPTQASLATSGGLAMVADGAGNIYLGILTASPGTVKYIKYNGSAWDAAWSTLESSSATRAYLTAVPQVVNNSIIWLWTEGTSSPFSIKGEALSLATSLQATLAGSGDLLGTLTVKKPLAATMAGAGDLAPTLKVAHALTATMSGSGDVLASLSVDRALSAILTGSGDMLASLTVKKPLQATLAGQGDLIATLTVAHALQAILSGSGDLQAALTVEKALAAILAGQGDLLAHLTAGVQGLSAILSGSGDMQANLSVAHALRAILDGSGDLQADVTIAHALSALLDGQGDLLARLFTPLATKAPHGIISLGTMPTGSIAVSKMPAGSASVAVAPGGTICVALQPTGTLGLGTMPTGTIEED